MSTEDPSQSAQTEPISVAALSGSSQPQQQQLKDQKPSKKKKKRKKKRDKSSKKSLGGIRRGGKSYGNNPRFNRRESIPHHATVQSLASINQPVIVNQLTKMSQDLKYHRELQKALMELKQKDEDYRYAIEIGESLTKENQFLKEQVELLESQLHTQETDNDILKEKLETLSSTYHQDLYKYHQDLQAHKELVNELNKAIQSKNEELSQQKEINHKQVKQNNLNTRSAINKMARMTSDDMNNLTSSDFNSGLEKQLFLQLEKEKKKHVEDQQTIENLMKKLDDMMDLKKKYDQLKKANKELKQITKDELAQHIQMQKSIESEAVYLAARNSNLEEEREDLINLLDQRDYEITMLNQSLQLQQKATTRSEHSQTLFGNQEATLGDDLQVNDEGSHDMNEYSYYDQDADDQGLLSDEDEIDIIAEILDDEDIFDQDVFGEDEEDDDDGVISKQPSLITEQLKQQSIQNSGDTKPTPKSPRTRGRDEKKDDEGSRDKKAFDKIKEYLHLTASAVKIKYPTVKNIQSDELIKRVKELPFYKYHDQMVRIMEAQLKKLRDAEKAKNQQLQTTEEFDDGPPPQLGKRRSFLSIFNIFGGDKDNDQSDNEGFDDNKSDVSDSEGPNDSGISGRRERRKSKTRKKKRSFKKRKHRKSLSKESKEKPDTNDNQSPKNNGISSGGMSRSRRGISAEMSQKRLKNNK